MNSKLAFLAIAVLLASVTSMTLGNAFAQSTSSGNGAASAVGGNGGNGGSSAINAQGGAGGSATAVGSGSSGGLASGTGSGASGGATAQGGNGGNGGTCVGTAAEQAANGCSAQGGVGGSATSIANGNTAGGTTSGGSIIVGTGTGSGSSGSGSTTITSGGTTTTTTVVGGHHFFNPFGFTTHFFRAPLFFNHNFYRSYIIAAPESDVNNVIVCAQGSVLVNNQCVVPEAPVAQAAIVVHEFEHPFLLNGKFFSDYVVTDAVATQDNTVVCNTDSVIFNGQCIVPRDEVSAPAAGTLVIQADGSGNVQTFALAEQAQAQEQTAVTNCPTSTTVIQSPQQFDTYVNSHQAFLSQYLFAHTGFLHHLFGANIAIR